MWLMRNSGKTYLGMTPRTIAQLLAFLFVAGMSVYAVFQATREADARLAANEREQEEDFYAQCLSNNETRETIRVMVGQIIVASSEALITVVGAEAEPATVEAYRAESVRQGEEIASQLPDRKCDEELEEFIERSR